MKKAYVKPVFLAEEFVAASSYAISCGPASINKALTINPGNNVCGEKIDGHTAGKGKAEINNNYIGVWPNTVADGENYSYWQYANQNDGKSNLFSSNNYECDFLWDYYSTGKNEIYVWENATAERNSSLGTLAVKVGEAIVDFANFFTHSSQSEGQHKPGYMGQSFQS